MYYRDKTILHFCNIIVWLRTRNEKNICFWNIIQTARESRWKKNKYFQLLTGGVWRRTGGVNAFFLPYLPRLHRFERTVKRRTRSNTYHTLTAFTVKGVGRFSFCRRPTAVFSVYVVFGRVSRQSLVVLRARPCWKRNTDV